MEIIRYKLLERIDEHYEDVDGVQTSVAKSFRKSPVEKLEFKPDTLEVFANDVLVDGNKADIVRSTNCFDSKGMEIWQGDYLEDEYKNIFEIMSACGSLFMIVQDEPILIQPTIAMRLTAIGNVYEDTDRLFPVAREVVDELNQDEKNENAI